MEFEDSPTVTERDRVQAAAPRVNLQPVHQNVQLKESPQSSRLSQTQGQGRSFEFETETTAAEAAEAAAHKQAGGSHHYVAMITAGVVCALFIGGVIVLQLSR